MVRGIILIALIAILSVATAFAEEPVSGKPMAPHMTSYASALEAGAAQHRPVIVDFYTTWCTWCKRLDTVTYVDPNVIDMFTNEMILVQVDAEVDTMLAKKYAISGYPTLVMMNSKGEEIDRVAGYLPPEEFMKTFRGYKEGKGTLADLLNQAKSKEDRDLFFQIADKYKYRGGSVDAESWYTKVIGMGKSTDSLSGESRVAIADIYRRDKNYTKALPMFQSISKDFTGTPFGEQGDIYTAIVYGKMGDTANAIKSFEGFIAKYPKSEDVEYAQKQIEKLKNPPAPEKKSS
ncbi:MAG: thioredoxin domain-containing protein [Candidatus Zixiibacteriota bacterium]